VFHGYLDVLEPDVEIILGDLSADAIAPYAKDMRIIEAERKP
jgi:hypothetical protein